jgi:membrane protein involved in colicin uptake
MSEEESIAQELHGHLTQMIRTSMSGGLQMTEQRARRRQHEAETERRLATEAARQLDERKRAEREASALVAQQTITRQEQERAADARRDADADADAGTRDAERATVEDSGEHASTAFPMSIDEALAGIRRPQADSTAKTCHERDRGTSRQPAELGR